MQQLLLRPFLRRCQEPRVVILQLLEIDHEL